MTTKRKQILKARAVAGSQIVDDLVDSTGLQRKNLQDNLKATLEAGLDAVEALPQSSAWEAVADRLRRAWLESDKDDSTSKPPIPTLLTHKPMLRSEPSSSVTTPAGGGDISPAVKDGATSLAVATPGQALTVVEPPMPDDAPAAVGSDEKKTLTWDDLYDQLRAKRKECMALREQIAAKDDEIYAMQRRGAFAPIGYAIIPDFPDMTIHQSLASARAEAEETVGTDGPIHVVALLATAEMAITWKNAA